MLTCREVTELIGTDAVARTPLRTRMAVRLHLLMCRHCRAYVRALRQLADAARRLATTEVSPTDPRANAILEAVQRLRASFEQGDRGS